MTPNKLSETQKAMDRQSGILGLDWSERVPAKARAALKGARSITFVGTGTSYQCALWAATLCREASGGKLPARALTSWDFLAGNYAKTAARDELHVVVSHRGNRGLTKKLLDAIAPRKRVLVTGEDSPTGSHPYVYTSPQETSLAHTMSLVGAMAACSELVARLLPAAAAKRLRADRELAAVLLQAIGAQIDDLEAALGGIVTRGAGLHFVGGGAFHAIALELSLKAREIIHVAAHAYNTEEFLHGPLASVDEEDTVVALEAFPPRTQAALSKLLEHGRLAACRKAAEALGCLVLEPSWDASIVKQAAPLAQAWQALLALYWGQVLCVSTAKSWGIDPDTNRRDDPRYAEAHRHTQL
ncbi:MAG: SIS domain-containing protein [Deltaproteobacteria bacterium]|nr:SIS domain-containing protein [Deltaproteobacteria bacterium]